MQNPLTGLNHVALWLAGTFLIPFADVFAYGEETTSGLSYEELILREITREEQNDPAKTEAPYVVLVSLDGFRHDYAERYGADNLLEMAKNGGSVRSLIPSFPSMTFPNHYTLATGLHPSRHGIVANSFFSRERNLVYRIYDRSKVEDGTWYEGLPLWNLARRHGLLSASFFWVGSEADIQGEHPSYHYTFDSTVPYTFRVRRVLDWLGFPEDRRPHLVTLYFSLTDTIGHNHGPESEEMRQAVKEVDAHIGTLREGIQTLDRDITLVVVSDHGMSETSRAINIADCVDLGDNLFLGGAVAKIYTKLPEETDRLYGALVNDPRFDTYLAGTLPNYLNYGHADREADIILLANPPDILIAQPGKTDEQTHLKGAHGYDPYRHTDMGGILFAEGPLIRKGIKLPPTESIHVYPFIAHLLGIEVGGHEDGCLSRLLPLIRRP